MFKASIRFLSHLASVFVDRVIYFGENLGDQVKCRSQKTLKSLVEVPYVANLKVQVLSFNLNLIFLRSVFLDRVIYLKGNFGDQVKGRSPKQL